MPVNQTDLTVLAVLSVGPATGYSVRELVHEQLGAFWSESFGQIYPSIARLAAAGSISAEAGERKGPAVYSLTPTGRDLLLDGLRTPPVAGRPRNGTLLRLFFGRLLGPQACAELVEEVADRARAQLHDLAAARAEVEAELAAGDENAPYWLLTISAGEHTARAAAAWAQETQAELARW